jgi:hypothetical protein
LASTVFSEPQHFESSRHPNLFHDFIIYKFNVNAAIDFEVTPDMWLAWLEAKPAIVAKQAATEQAERDRTKAIWDASDARLAKDNAERAAIAKREAWDQREREKRADAIAERLRVFRLPPLTINPISYQTLSTIKNPDKTRRDLL